jgi:hypothetical protein
MEQGTSGKAGEEVNRTTQIALLLIVSGIMGAGINLLSNQQTGPSPAPGPTDKIQFTSTDTGADTASKYVRAYCRNLAVLARKTAERTRSTKDGSLDIAKDWQKASEVARIEASKGVDARVAELIKSGASREECAKFMDEVTTTFERLGK